MRRMLDGYGRPGWITNRCRYNERLKIKTEGSKRLSNTGFHGGRVNLKIETRLRGEMFESVRGEYEI